MQMSAHLQRLMIYDLCVRFEVPCMLGLIKLVWKPFEAGVGVLQ